MGSGAGFEAGDPIWCWRCQKRAVADVLDECRFCRAVQDRRVDRAVKLMNSGTSASPRTVRRYHAPLEDREAELDEMAANAWAGAKRPRRSKGIDRAVPQNVATWLEVAHVRDLLELANRAGRCRGWP